MARRLLLVDDDADTREQLGVLLETRGCRVVTAANGRDALRQIAAEGNPCMIILDLIMPVMDGFEFRAALLEDEDLADVPVVVMSAVGDLHPDLSTMNLAGWLNKPVDLPRLYALIEQHC